MTRRTARATRHILAGAAFFGLVETSEGATLHVSNRGVDGPSCGSPANRCRSISQAIANALPGDTIMVGPGIYSGDLNHDYVVGDPGEETGSPGCGCMLSVNKSVIVLSTDGAAATVIHADNVGVNTNVLIIADSVEFGRPNHGFTVTQTLFFASTGIAIDGHNVKVRGNQAAPTRQGGGTVGIGTVSNDFATVLIESNQVAGWSTAGISAVSARKTVSKNHVSGNLIGIRADGGSGINGNISIAGNVVTTSEVGIDLKGAVSATGNAIVGNLGNGIGVSLSFTGTITKNNIFGNHVVLDGNCGLSNIGLSGVAATGNYWGAASGPGLNPADDICNLSGGTTITTPFATGPFAINPTFDP